MQSYHKSSIYKTKQKKKYLQSAVKQGMPVWSGPYRKNFAIPGLAQQLIWQWRWS